MHNLNFDIKKHELKKFYASLGRETNEEEYLNGAIDRLMLTSEILITDIKENGLPEHLIDFGAFPGFLALFAKEILRIPKVTAISLVSTDKYQMALKKRDILTVQADFETNRIPVDDQSSDYIIFSEVLEHLIFPHNALKEIDRLLKPGSSCFVSSPNMGALRFRLSLLMGRPILDPLIDEEKISKSSTTDYRGHVRTYLPVEAIKLFRCHGFSLKIKKWTEHSLDRQGFLAFIKRNTRKLITSVFPSLKDTWIILFKKNKKGC